MKDNEVQRTLTRMEHATVADGLKQDRSPDYCEGFDAGVQWLYDYLFGELLNWKKYPQQNSDEEY